MFALFGITHHEVDGVECNALKVDGLANGNGHALVAEDVVEAPDHGHARHLCVVHARR